MLLVSYLHRYTHKNTHTLISLSRIKPSSLILPLGLTRISTVSTHSVPIISRGLATTLTSHICWNHAKRRASLQQRKWSRVTRRTNKMGSGHFAQYERSFYIDSTYLPYPPIAQSSAERSHVKRRMVCSNEYSEDIVTRPKMCGPVRNHDY